MEVTTGGLFFCKFCNILKRKHILYNSKNRESVIKMQNQKVIRAQRYLARFDEILNNMAKEMLSQTVTGSITIDFIKCMIPHHQAAIYMSQNLLQYTKYPPLERIARNIIQMQTKGIEQMREIEKTTLWYNNTPRDVNMYITKYLEITRNMITKMRNSTRCININLNFTSEMIPHHEGAIAMCENLLQYNIDPRLKIVANNIIYEQSQGVSKLKEVQKSLYRK